MTSEDELTKRQQEVDAEIEGSRRLLSFRLRWCESKECWCMGCINRGFRPANISKEEWLNWKERHGHK